jgi:hypothetical protein
MQFAQRIDRSSASRAKCIDSPCLAVMQFVHPNRKRQTAMDTTARAILADLRSARAAYQSRLESCAHWDDEQRAHCDATLQQIDADIARYTTN